MKKDIRTYLESISKEQLLNDWESVHVEDEGPLKNWEHHLDNISDPTQFNLVILSCLFRVIDNWVQNKKVNSYNELDDHIDEIKADTKKMCQWLPDFKYYFGCQTKKEMLAYDLSKYQF